MNCKNCGKENEINSKFCTECGFEFKEIFEMTGEIPVNSSSYESPIDALLVDRFVRGKLSIYKDRLEFDFNRNNTDIKEIYHYFNIKSITADNSFKMPSLVVETTDNEKMFFNIADKNIIDINEKVSLINQTKANSPSLEELGLTTEDMEKELKENKEKRKSDTTKKALNFLSQYKSFGSLSLKDKILHIALPLVIIFVFIGIFTSGGASDEDYISCAQTVINQQLKSPSTASYSNAKVVEKDDYGRVLVTMCVDAQNAFGAYIRNYYAIVIENYDPDTEKFDYYPNGITRWTDEQLEDIYLDSAKVASHWNEPLEND